jgi:hypothetical protein
MNRVLPPRLLRRLANILDADADCIGQSHGLIFGVDPPQTTEERARNPIFPPDAQEAARDYRERRRLAKRLRETAG